MHASTKGSFVNPSLEDDNATSLEIKPPKQERKATEKETVHGNAVQGSNRALLTLVITLCLIFLTVLLLTLLMWFGKIGDGCGCFADKDSEKIKALEGNIRSLQLGLTKHLDDLAEFNNTLIKTEAGYNALRDDLNMTRSELLLITDNITLTSRLEYLDAVLMRLKSALNRTNTDLAELKSTQTKESVIYHQTMTPSWLVAHASYVSIYRLNTTEQLEFIAGAKELHAALFKVPIIPANVLKNSSQLTVKIVVNNDVNIGTNEDSDIFHGMSDGISFVGFETADKLNLIPAPCFGSEGSSGATLTRRGVIGELSGRPKDSFYPGQFVITLKLNERWGSCYTAHDGGFVKTVRFTKRLVLSKELTLEVYKHEKDERVGIKFMEVTIVEDV